MISHNLYSCAGDGRVYQHRTGNFMDDPIDVDALILKSNDIKVAYTSKITYRIYSNRRRPQISAASGAKMLISAAPSMLSPLIFWLSLSWNSWVFFTREFLTQF